MLLSYPFSDGIETRSHINHYKRRDVFLCQQEGHRAFDYRVSVYHVLKEKRCYPHGCVSFSWKCSRFAKGSSCSRGFRRVGRMCFGCKFFIDEKINHRPRVVLSPARFDAFKNELREFESWLRDFRGREVNFSGTVFSVKPNAAIDPSRNWRTSFHGFLLVFKEGFVNLVRWKDFCYVRVSGRVQERYRFRPGDKVDFFARLTEDRGRIILIGINRVEIDHRAEGSWWNASKARVALQTGRIIDGQPDKCLNCGGGCLVDVKPSHGMSSGVHRRLFCLEGVKDPRFCTRGRVGEETWDGCGAPPRKLSGSNNLTTLSNVAISHVIRTVDSP